VRNLTKRYGDTEVVRGLDLDVRRGECFGLLGPNGAGKTTTLRLLLGLIGPDSGIGLAQSQCLNMRASAHEGRRGAR
jgi:ABC-type multidrug transport system ATPase subunit